MTLILALLSCAPEYDDASVKAVGVGYDPEQIGPAPTPYGGVVEYSWVNFSGAGLSLALMQLGSFDEVGPGMSGFAPPYAAVYGFSYLFSEKLSSADSLAGVTSVPPEAEESCYTTYEASGPIGSFKTVDVGAWMELVTKDGTGGLRMDRNPAQYPADTQDAFAYYNAVDLWSETASYAWKPGDSERTSDMESVLVHRRSFPAGEEVTFRFPGGKAPEHAPLGSLPVPSSAVGETRLTLPSLPGGVQVEWSGPRYDEHGLLATAEGAHRTCLAFAGDAVVEPQGPADCAGASSALAEAGQMYTAPWDTDDGKVLFRWEPGENPDEYVSLAVRFLGPIDREDPNFLTEVVSMEPTRAAKAEWSRLVGTGAIPDSEAPDGARAPTACEPDGEYELDQSYLEGDGDLVPSMRGDPFHNMAEVTCRLKDDGEFALTEAIVADALTYARAHGSEGVVFYFGRSTEAEVEVPDAMDNYGSRKVITPIKVAARAIDIGRFWFEE